MAINYTWNVNTVDVKEINGNTDTVFNVHWVLTATDDTNNDAEGNPQTATASSTIVLDTSSISNFIPFEDLTVSKVQGWVEDALNKRDDTKVEIIKNVLASDIANKINPPFQTKILETK